MSATDQNSDELNSQLRQLRGLIYGNWNTCVTCAFAELNLADLLAAGERTADELARATATDPDALARFLRCAAGLGLVAWQRKSETIGLGDGGSGGDPLNSGQRADHPGEIAADRRRSHRRLYHSGRQSLCEYPQRPA